MKRIISYVIKDEVTDKILAEENTELHEFEQNDASKYFAVKRTIDRAEDIIRNLK